MALMDWWAVYKPQLKQTKIVRLTRTKFFANWLDTALSGVWSGSTLFAQVCLGDHLTFTTLEANSADYWENEKNISICWFWNI